ncbi:MAG: DUF4149 domain-containing protein [Pseudomonadota bacterium]
MKPRIGIFAAALWWGSLTTIGFVVVPMLFVNLGTPAAAGAMAAKLFTAQTWVSIGCTFLLLLALNKKDPDSGALAVQPIMKFIVAGLLLALLVEFGVSPRIVSARADGGNLKLWHGLGTAMYVLQWLAAGATLWLLAHRSPTATVNQP